MIDQKQKLIFSSNHIGKNETKNYKVQKLKWLIKRLLLLKKLQDG